MNKTTMFIGDYAHDPEQRHSVFDSVHTLALLRDVQADRYTAEESKERISRRTMGSEFGKITKQEEKPHEKIKMMGQA